LTRDYPLSRKENKKQTEREREKQKKESDKSREMQRERKINLFYLSISQLPTCPRARSYSAFVDFMPYAFNLLGSLTGHFFRSVTRYIYFLTSAFGKPSA
jgi:hypothetical protein